MNSSMSKLFKLFLIGLISISVPSYGSYVEMAGSGPWWPDNHLYNLAPALSTIGTLAATGNKIAFAGTVKFSDRNTSSKTISRIGFRFGTIVKAGGSNLMASIQHISTVAGPPIQPDGVQLSTCAILNSEMASATWLRSEPFGTAVNVNSGDAYAVVVEFDSGGRLGSDSFPLVSLGSLATAAQPGYGVMVTSISVAAPWTASTLVPAFALEFTDGTFGTLVENDIPLSNLATVTFSSSSAINEWGEAFWFPFNCKIDGIRTAMLQGAGSINAVLYQGNSALQTVTVSSTSASTISAARWYNITIPETTLTANTTYFVSFVPQNTANISQYKFQFDQTVAGGPFTIYDNYANLGTASRTAGTWSTIASTETFATAVHISAVDSGTGGGGTRGAPFAQ